MKNTTHISLSLFGASPSPLRHSARAFPLATAMLLLVLLTPAATFAGSATWQTSPGSGNWNTATNWMPNTVPNAPSDTATFQSSNVTGVSLSANTAVNGIVFNTGASPFTITTNPARTLTISGAGITNNSETPQSFVLATDEARHRGTILFTNSATAGFMTTFTNKAGAIVNSLGSQITFRDSSTAGGGTFINATSPPGGSQGGVIDFFEDSSAENGVFFNHGGRPQTQGGVVNFHDNTTAADATFTNLASEESGGFPSSMEFFDNSSAGSGSFTNAAGGRIFFTGSSTAGNGTFVNKGSAVSGGALSGAFGADIRFFETSTVGNGTIINNGGTVSGALGATTAIIANSSGSMGTLIANGGAVSGAGGGATLFLNATTAGNATLIANGGLGGGAGGVILFGQTSTGGTARVEVFSNGNLDISQQYAGGITIGSLEGSGRVFLGSDKLTVGSNHLSTFFSGVIQDGGSRGGTGGSLTKIGTGKLVLSHRNSYTGGTTIDYGRLVVNNIGGSGTGSGRVQVNRGKLGGKGEIAGAVTVGTGTGGGAVLAPGYLHGIGSPGALTIQSSLTFNSDATYELGINSSSVKRDEVVALGVTINGGARFAFVDIGSGILPVDTIFTVINNTAATPIAGTFSNLPDGSTFTSNGNTFKVDYQGGDGNDLTLTVQ